MIKNIDIFRDGLKLRGILDIPSNSATNLAIIFHGFRGNKADPFIQKISNGLTKENISTLRFDFAGLGESEGSFTDMTVFSELIDANKILEYALSLGRFKKIYLVGHSQGGVIASMLAGYYPDIISKLVLVSPAATLVEDARRGQLQMANYDPIHVPKEIPLINNFNAGGFYVRTAKYMPIYEVAQHYTGRVCLIHAGNDKVVNEIASERYHAMYNDSVLHIIAGADHSFYERDYGERATRIIKSFLLKDK